MIQKIVFTIATLCATATTMAQTPNIYVAESTKNVRKEDSKSVNFRGTPLLQAFRMRYVIKDHHINTVAIMPEGNRVNSTFRDKNGDDPYKWSSRFASLDRSGIVSREISGRDEIGSAVHQVTVPNNMLFVLQGFHLSFAIAKVGRGTDRHIKRVAVFFENGAVRISFHDKNADDRFSYKVKYALVPKSLFLSDARKIDLQTDSGTGESGAVSGQGVPVICGFDFQYAGGDDKHLREIGCQLKPGNALGTFFDKNNDDKTVMTVYQASLGVPESKPVNLRGRLRRR